MPVTRTEQARIELSKAQCKALMELFEKVMAPMVALEETNIPNVIAVKTNRGFTLIHHDGTMHKLGHGVNPTPIKSARRSK